MGFGPGEGAGAGPAIDAMLGIPWCIVAIRSE